MLQVNAQLTIPDAELNFSFARSSGPGGQNVNKVNSKATLHWNVVNSPTLPAPVRQRFLAKYSNRVSREGFVVIASQRYRDQPKNVDDCLTKLAEMIRDVWRPPKARRATKPTRGSKERRIEAKRHQATKKTQRRWQE